MCSKTSSDGTGGWKKFKRAVTLSSNKLIGIDECWARRPDMYLEIWETICKIMKNGIFWNVTPCGSCKNRRFGGT
jgi:hypothetical protein